MTGMTMTQLTAPRRWWLAAIAIAVVCGLVAFASGSARADFGIATFDGQVLNQDGTASTQAGAHPWAITTSIAFNSHVDPDLFGLSVPDGSVKDLTVDLPAGFAGDPTTLPRCTVDQLSKLDNIPCPLGSQVGIINVNTLLGSAVIPVYNMTPPDDAPAAFGFSVVGVPVIMTASVRTDGDYGLSLHLRDIGQAIVVLGADVTFWGVPEDSSHDSERGSCLESTPFDPSDLCPTDTPRRPFLRNPTRCTPAGVGLEWRVSTTSWQDPSTVATASYVSHLTPPDQDVQQGPTNCESVPFDASLTAVPSSTQAGAPSGYAFDLRIPQETSVGALAQSDLRTAVVQLPEGVGISPSSADGLQACTDAQIGIGTMASPACPDASKIGTVQIETPLLEGPLTGSIFLGSPRPGQLFRLYLVAQGSGVLIKLSGTVVPDTATGRLTATFADAPQLPFSHLHLEFKGGPRAPLTNPGACGTYTTSAQLTGWSGRVVTSDSSFTLSRDGNGAPCVATAFSPGFEAGSVNPAAGKDSPFVMTASRDDGQPYLRDIAVSMPPGLLGRIARVPELCSDAQAAAGSCAEASRIGSVTTTAGAGAEPLHLSGRVYLTGPYHGAPFGLSIVVPAIAGPFDLGTVVVRAAIFVDRDTAALRVASDPLPTILAGVPLRIRSVSIVIDRDHFMFNPTSCTPRTVGGTIGAVGGATALVSSRFQVGGCSGLSYAPRMSLRVGGRGHTRRGATTPLSVILRQGAGQANNKTIDVTLPSTLNARLGVVAHACTLAAFHAGTCAASARVGTALAVTPVLKDPLRGTVYFVKNPARSLPDMMVALRGQVAVDLTGIVSLPGGKLLRTRFTAPDVPISLFRLRLSAGRQSPLGVTRSLCSVAAKRASVARLAFRAQNGKALTVRKRLQVAGCASRRSH
jgi:hypothetical protein